MPRLIDADALKDKIFSKWGMHPKYMTSMSFNAEQDCYVLEVLNAAPTIEQKHGHWEAKFITAEQSMDNVPELRIKCPECGHRWLLFRDDPTPPYKYCPNCGADMRGVTE